MPLPVLILMLSITALFIILGILIKYLGCYWLIAGYNTMPQEKKENVDVEGLGSFLGNSLFLIGGIFLLGTVMNFFGYTLAFILSLASLFLITPYMLIKAQKYDKNNLTESGKIKTSIKAIIGLLILVLLIVGSMIIYGSLDNEVSLNANSIEIKGKYGATINFSEIERISLIDELPPVNKKVNGFKLGDILKGYFDLETLGEGILFIQRGQPPYIYIELKDSYIIINSEDPNVTQELYSAIYKQQSDFQQSTGFLAAPTSSKRPTEVV